MLDQPFMDEVHRATYHEMAPGAHKDKRHKQVLAEYRAELRRAQRFMLDDDAVRLICRMSRQEGKIELWSILARLPYDTIWLELDLHEKVKEWERMGTIGHPFNPKQVSQKCGYLIRKDKDSKTRWVASEFIEINEGAGSYVCPQPVALVFDPEGSVLKPVTGCMLWNTLTLSKRFGMKMLPVTVKDVSNVEVTLDCKVDPEFAYMGLFNVHESGIVAPPELEYKVGAVPERMWEDWVQKEYLDPTMLQDALERSGSLKWIITALAMINDVPTTTQYVAPRKGAMATRSGPIKYLDQHVITIKIPKGQTVAHVGRELTSASIRARKAWEQVRGHWRTIERGKRSTILCRHEPTLVEDGLAICTRCERLIRWIDDYHRGDPQLGVVEHGYLVQS